MCAGLGNGAGSGAGCRDVGWFGWRCFLDFEDDRLLLSVVVLVVIGSLFGRTERKDFSERLLKMFLAPGSYHDVLHAGERDIAPEITTACL
jgi:hypothetical protein